MGKQEVINTLTNEWQTAKEISKKLNQKVGTPLKKLRKCGEIRFRYIKKDGYWQYEYRL
jgi:hypothetical protein